MSAKVGPKAQVCGGFFEAFPYHCVVIIVLLLLVCFVVIVVIVVLLLLYYCYCVVIVVFPPYPEFRVESPSKLNGR